MGKNTSLKMLAADKSLAAPLSGCPGIQLTGTNLKTNLFNPRLQADSIMRLSETTGVDVVFQLMDLSIEAGALGLPVRYPAFESPTVETHPVETAKDLAQFANIDVMADCRVWTAVETVRILKREQKKPVAAYICGPFSLAGLLIGATEIFLALFDKPADVQEIIRFAARRGITYARRLREAGADLICMLEPTAMMLPPDDFVTYAGNHIKGMTSEIDAPVILHICGNTTQLISSMGQTGAAALSLDMAVDLPAVMPRLPKEICVMGNIDPANLMRRGTPEAVGSAVRELKRKMLKFDNFILSTGCNLPPDTPLENITAFVKAAKE
ncbi:MAG: uroporphyrinogen decarboxylase family protein [Victivallaceae bacterium]|nr:uroporphyrinogen decarboxylase family protein [Victivallaceae bacterium]